jgi:hypothetical protein
LTDEVPGCYEANCKREEPDLTEEEEEQKWSVPVMDNLYDVKAKVFGTTMMIDGVARPKGSYRFTYEIMAEDSSKSLTYNLKHLPLYKMKIRGMGDDQMFSLMFHSERNKTKPVAYDLVSVGGIGSSILSEYKIFLDKKKNYIDVQEKIKEKGNNLWKKEIDVSAAMDKYMFDDDDDEDEEEEEDDYDKFSEFSDDI